MESDQISKLKNSTDCVIALGGGSVEFVQKELIHSLGWMVYLNAPFDIIWGRMQHGGIYSYLDPKDPEGSLKAVMERRLPLFEKAADIMVDTSGLDVDNVQLKSLNNGTCMASNSFGNIFRITTWGESHGKAIGVVIDGCPAGLPLNETEIHEALALRAPGRNAFTTPRKELEKAEILSGVFEGITTGAPISIIIPNQDVDSSKYEPIKNLLRPGHANFTYLEKYGIFDYRGGGRSSARETACRVAAGVVAKKLLAHYTIQIVAYVKQVGDVEATIHEQNPELLRSSVYKSPVYCPDPTAASTVMALIENAKTAGDSLGGVIEFIATSLPVGLGDPVYNKLEANLASAMMSLPATKGFEIGSGFGSVKMLGSTHNDLFTNEHGKVETSTNHSGGTLGGISNGMDLVGRVAFKPTSSIMLSQETLTTTGDEASIQLPVGSRHDPCVAIRAVPIVEAMVALVLADAILLNRCARL